MLIFCEAPRYPPAASSHYTLQPCPSPQWSGRASGIVPQCWESQVLTPFLHSPGGEIIGRVSLGTERCCYKGEECWKSENVLLTLFSISIQYFFPYCYSRYRNLCWTPEFQQGYPHPCIVLKLMFLCVCKGWDLLFPHLISVRRELWCWVGSCWFHVCWMADV